jgi:hypothetical protein
MRYELNDYEWRVIKVIASLTYIPVLKRARDCAQGQRRQALTYWRTGQQRAAVRAIFLRRVAPYVGRGERISSAVPLNCEPGAAIRTCFTGAPCLRSTKAIVQ